MLFYRLLSICVCRFILALRQVYLPEMDDGPQTLNGHTTGKHTWLPSLSRLVANFGAPLAWGHNSNQDDNDDNNIEEQEVICISADPLSAGLRLASEECEEGAFLRSPDRCQLCSDV